MALPVVVVIGTTRTLKSSSDNTQIPPLETREGIWEDRVEGKDVMGGY